MSHETKELQNYLKQIIEIMAIQNRNIERILKYILNKEPNRANSNSGLTIEYSSKDLRHQSDVVEHSEDEPINQTNLKPYSSNVGSNNNYSSYVNSHQVSDNNNTPNSNASMVNSYTLKIHTNPFDRYLYNKDAEGLIRLYPTRDQKEYHELDLRKIISHITSYASL
ncbi:hypothetical protein CONCODRAFT_3084 [Conidiobolus coronatus NRRL 28638]|uniref:Uncharacterized protein n=1 Tax=Conidiobolus coronatus (strain ATCC 28846 / CBS 209.66 / NRRL 28638) TaxID=796925 RepID=A0A137PFR1_CONC2|nr:hypothetical protein CONCODRAFT_3084 [Conidiobolus coronatus NRRL 28638]|eukprot:KXN73846.1 hypothetical protein CONCODRAFT_3084 [Conidiobolus coronatus NRRL 28638]